MVLVKFDIPENQKHNLNYSIFKELYQKYGYRSGKKIKPKWVEELMSEIDPHKYLLEWDVAEISLSLAVDLLKILKANPQLGELKVIFPSGALIIRPDERVVEVYEKIKELV
ncbi:MAG: hypothetical protein ACP5IJ_01085 [Candidatus Nanoarchaeia archaeon]